VDGRHTCHVDEERQSEFFVTHFLLYIYDSLKKLKIDKFLKTGTYNLKFNKVNLRSNKYYS
jgi:hypothetical protein